MQKVFYLCGVLVLAGCAQPAEPDPPQVPSGSLKIKIAGGLSSTGTASSRALLRAREIRVNLERSNGAALMEPATILLDPDNPEVPEIGPIPAGVGHRGVVELLASPSQGRRVLLRAEGRFDLGAGEAASLSLTFLPVDWEELLPGQLPVERTCPEDGELWFKVPVQEEGTLTLKLAGSPAYGGLFDAEGKKLTLISEQATSRTFRTSGELYLGVWCPGGGLIRIDGGETVPPPNEGTPEEPVLLTGSVTERVFRVGVPGSGKVSSWYAFVPSRAGVWAVDLPYTSALAWTLKGGDGTTMEGTGTSKLVWETLSPGVRYTLQLVGVKNPQLLKLPGRLVGPEEVETVRHGEGSPEQPRLVPLEPGLQLKIGGRNFDSKSWFKIVNGGLADLELTFGEAGTGTCNMAVYPDGDWSTPLVSWAGVENSRRTLTLVPGQSYGLLVSSVFSSGFQDGVLPLGLSPLPPPLPRPLPLEQGVTGSLSPGEGVWYKATLPGGGTWQVQWDDRSQGTGSHTGDIRVSVFGPDRREVIFRFKDNGFTTSYRFDLRPEEKELWVYVEGNTGTSAGTYGLRLLSHNGVVELILN